MELAAAIRSAIEEVERLIRLAEALLLLDHAGEAPLRLQRLDARELLEAVARRFAARGAIEISGDGSFRGDRDRLEQALGSLVDNAFTHGEGTVRLEASLRTARLRSGSATTAPASRTTSSRARSTASAVRTRRGRPVAPDSGSQSSRPSPARTAAVPPPPDRP